MNRNSVKSHGSPNQWQPNFSRRQSGWSLLKHRLRGQRMWVSNSFLGDGTATYSGSHFENHFRTQGKILQTKAEGPAKIFTCDIWFSKTHNLCTGWIFVSQRIAIEHYQLKDENALDLGGSPITLPDLWKCVWGGLTVYPQTSMWYWCSQQQCIPSRALDFMFLTINHLNLGTPVHCVLGTIKLG